MNNISPVSNIIVSDDFRILVQDLNEKDFIILKRDLEGKVLVPKVKLWDRYLLSDFQIYEYCENAGIPVMHEELDFPGMTSAQSWVCSEQLKRTDLSEEYRKYLIGQKFLFEVAIQKEERAKLFSDRPIGTFSISQSNKTKIAKSIGSELGINFGTVQKYSVYSEAIDQIHSMEPRFVKMILNGTVKVSHKNVLRLAEQSKEGLTKIMNYVEDNRIEHLGYSELTSDFQWKEIQQPLPPKTSDEVPKIRLMPAYDPDAEISSMALTIPSWVSSMERAHNRTDYSKTSVAARINLVKQLAILERTIYIVQKEIEEVL